MNEYFKCFITPHFFKYKKLLWQKLQDFNKRFSLRCLNKINFVDVLNLQFPFTHKFWTRDFLSGGDRQSKDSLRMARSFAFALMGCFIVRRESRGYGSLSLTCASPLFASAALLL
jgi:hypothetical protein